MLSLNKTQSYAFALSLDHIDETNSLIFFINSNVMNYRLHENGYFLFCFQHSSAQTKPSVLSFDFNLINSLVLIHIYAKPNDKSNGIKKAKQTEKADHIN